MVRIASKPVNLNDIRGLSAKAFGNAVNLELAEVDLLSRFGGSFKDIVVEERALEAARRADAGPPPYAAPPNSSLGVYESKYSDGQFKALLASLLSSPLTLGHARDALLSFAPERLGPAVIQAYRAVTSQPAKVLVLKFEKLVDQLIPDESEEPSTDLVVCEECARPVNEPHHRWCQDCWLRVFHPSPNSR